MQRDIIHRPVIVDDERAECAECGIELPFQEAEIASKMTNGAILDVGGLGAFCPTVRGTLGREAIACSHPSAIHQLANSITVAQCPDCGNEPQISCTTCEGSGLIGFIPDPRDPDHPQIVKVSAGELSQAQQKAEGLTTERMPTTSDIEKMVHRGQFAMWMDLRAQIREGATGLDQ